MAGSLILQIGHRVLGDQDKAVGGDEVVDAVVDLRVHVVGPAADHQNGAALLPGLGDVLPGSVPQVVLVGVVGGVGGLDGGGGLLLGDLELVAEPLAGPLLEVLGAVEAEVGVQIPGLLQVRDVGGQQLRVVGHHGAVVIVVADPLVEVVGHTGVEDGVHPLLHQGLHMAVEQLGGVADGVRGDGALALQIQLAAGLGGQDHLKVQTGEQLEPEGQVLIHVKAEGDADPAPGAVSPALALHGAQLVVFIPHQVGLAAGLLPQGAGAPVARDEPPPAVEGVDGEGAVVGTQAAGGGLGGVGEALQLLGREQGALFQVQVPGGQGGAEGPHDAGDGGPGHVPAQLLFKGPEHRVVVEGAALDHDVLPQIVGGGGPDDLINGVFHDGGGQAGGDVGHAGPVLLCLLHAGIHEHGAAGAQIHRLLGKQAQLGEVGNIVAQSLGEGLDEGAAARGAGLVEHDGVHGPVADLEALHVLAADVDDEVHVGLEMGGGLVVGHGLHQAQIAVEGVFNKVLAVAGDGGSFDLDAVAAHGVDLFQLFQDNSNGVALVGVVVGVQQAAVGGDEGQLGGGGAGVQTQPGGAGVSVHVHLRGLVGVVPGAEGVVLLLAGEQGGHGVHQGGGVHALLQLFQRLLKEDGLVIGGAQGRAHGGEAVAVLGENGVVPIQLQRLNEPLPQAHEEVQRTAQEYDFSLQLPALGETGHGLVHHRLEDGSGHVLFPPALVQDGLNVALGEDAAAGGDGIDLLMLQRQAIQLLNGHVHQGSHLVDEGPGAPGAGAVHPLLQRAAEEDDLGVLAPQLDDGVGVRDVCIHRGGGGVDLLDKVDARGGGHPQASGAGDGDLDALPGEHIPDGAEGLAGPLTGLGIVPLIGAEQQLVFLIQHHDLDGGAADVDSYTQTHN